MDHIDTAFWQTIGDSLQSKRVIALIIAEKLERQGISVDDALMAMIEAGLNEAKDGIFPLHLDERYLQGVSSEELSLKLTSEDAESFVSSFIARLTERLPTILDEMAVSVLRRLKADAPEMLRQRHAEHSGFIVHLREKWGAVFDLLDMLIVISYEAGDDINHEFRPKCTADNQFVFDVLTRLHARACQIAQEALLLIRGGFADGAHARWRTMHELSVTASFIQDHGNDLAERYLHHVIVESYHAAKQHQKYAHRLHEKPCSPAEIATLKQRYDHEITRYGASFSAPYGWAVPAFPQNQKKVTFADIEAAVQLDHWRPYFKMACHNVHAGPKGILFKLGEYPGREVLLAGPSDRGLEEPIQGMAISLMHTTMCLLMMEPNIDRLVLCKVITQLVDEIQHACDKSGGCLPHGSED